KCFKLFNDVNRNWTEAHSKCQEENHMLAMPTDADAVGLRKVIYDKYGRGLWMWLDGMASAGSENMMVQGNTMELSRDHMLWRPYEPEFREEEDMCLVMPLAQWFITNSPTQVYHTAPCNKSWATLCEAIV
ncbi:unnamed protein product, partial [Meganyctiphanes norvegica]